MNIFVFTSLWPNSEQPNFGLFVKNRIVAIAKSTNVRVVAPIPYFPKSMRSSILPEHWRRMARIPEREVVGGIETFHPRYPLTPKLGMTLYGRWMARGVEKLIRQLNNEKPIDVIDAHYVYPDGYAAVILGARLNVPVVITARGTDINLFSRMPLIRPMIRKALMRADGVIAVSDALKQRMIELGIEAGKIAVIRNGVDREVFHPRDRMEARRKLGLDAVSQIIITVAALVPHKGIDRLIDAMALIRNAGVKLYVIGEGNQRAALESQIAKRNLTDRVFLIGSRPQMELADWYSAADLFCLASLREGCPNAVIEAMACGLPVVAADVGGVNELISRPNYGRLASLPTPENLAPEIEVALHAKWDRAEISESGGARSWMEVAAEVMKYYAERKIRIA